MNRLWVIPAAIRKATVADLNLKAATRIITANRQLPISDGVLAELVLAAALMEDQ